MGGSMIWNVFIQRVNTRKIEPYNIFEHISFKKDVEVALATAKDKAEFAEKLKRELRYYFWSKCEWEVIITDWPTHVSVEEVARLDKEILDYVDKWGKKPYSLSVNLPVASKVDVYDQVMLNWEVFVDYVWNLRN